MIIQFTDVELKMLVYHARQIDPSDAPEGVSSNPILKDRWIAAQAVERMLNPLTAVTLP